MPRQAVGGTRARFDGAALCLYKVWDEAMARQVGVVLYVLALIAVVVSVDILFVRHHFTERLIANVGIVLVFAAFGFLIFRGLGRRQE